MKTLLLISTLLLSLNAMANANCTYGDKHIIKVAKATVSSNGMAKIGSETIALSVNAEGLELGTEFKGLVVKICYDIGHIPGVVSYWKEMIIPEQQLLEEM